MLTGLETRLAEVIGQALEAPFAGRVRRRGAEAPAGDGPVIRVGVDAIEPLDPDLGSVRPEPAPGAPARRRVVRLGVMLGVAVQAGAGQGREQEVRALDALLYLLDDPELRSARALVEPGDQGFRLDGLHLVGSPVAAGPALALRAEGWFWPPGEPGLDGPAIDRVVVREVRLPVRLRIEGALVAGGADVALTVTLGGLGALESDGTVAGPAPVGPVGLRLVGRGGGPGAGALAGGAPGPDGVRLVEAVDGAVGAVYTPPAQAARDTLEVLAAGPGAGAAARVGMVLARFELAVRG